MLDIQLLRSNPEEVVRRLATRGGTPFDATRFRALEDERKSQQTRTQELQAKRNALSKQIGQFKAKGEDTGAVMREVAGIGDALKAKDVKVIPAAAQAIAADSHKINALFPAGSTDPKSRALPAIWQDFPKFEKLSADLGTSADALAKAAADPAGDPGAAAKAMFSNYKACHDAFRKPDEKEKK